MYMYIYMYIYIQIYTCKCLHIDTNTDIDTNTNMYMMYMHMLYIDSIYCVCIRWRYHCSLPLTTHFSGGTNLASNDVRAVNLWWGTEHLTLTNIVPR